MKNKKNINELSYEAKKVYDKSQFSKKACKSNIAFYVFDCNNRSNSKNLTLSNFIIIINELIEAQRYSAYHIEETSKNYYFITFI
ncbi:MAG: hypothetical protein GX377_00100 [Erysipelotrichaceae bacterium]|nr:hypothetical protein [Erysipelotrichaceae bacterium]